MRATKIPIAIFLVLGISFQSISEASASTPKAWSRDSISAVPTGEVQGLFGTQVFSASSDLNWSKRITPTAEGQKYVFNRPWIYYALPPCSAQIQIGCIAAVEYSQQDDVWKSAILSKRELPNRNGEVAVSGRMASGEVISMSEINVWPADSESHTPAAGKASYWHFPGAKHGGGDEYLVRANVAGINSAQATWANGKVQRYLEMGVFPVDGLTEYQFPQELKIRVRLNLGVVLNDLWGWFHGRVISPDVVMNLKSPLGTLEISGAPSATPMGLTEPKKVAELSSNFRLFGCDNQPGINTCLPKPGLLWFSTDGNSDISIFSAFEKEFKELSTVGIRSEWWIETTRWPNDALVENCSAPQNGFAGIVTTNSTMYKAAPPTWDATDKSFVFQVASPHKGLDGKLNQGYYSLVLPLALAECRWGKELSQAKAVVSIVSNDGATQVGVATFKIAENLLIFNISGFNYSAPKIKVGLSIKPQSEVVEKNTSKQIVPPVKKTITCKKGSKEKKITAASPKCPTGYKKK
jgi:hypothetical protein